MTHEKIGEIERFAVTYVEYGDSVDGKARILGLYRTHAEALCEMHLDANRYHDELGLDRCDFPDMDTASVGSTDECGCEYRIDKVTIPVFGGELPEKEVEKNGDGDTVVHAYVEIPVSEIRKWNDLMSADRLDYDALGFKPHENVASWTAKFPDGCFADIKVNTGEKDHELYCEAVLFDALGSQVAFSHEASYELDGPDWVLWAGDNEYRVHVVEKENEDEIEGGKEA